MKSALIFLFGVVAGVLLVSVIWPLLGSTTTFEAREDLIVSSNSATAPRSFVIPKGTVFVHDTFFSEGFDSLELYVNAADREKFVIGQSKFDRIPCWVAPEQPGTSPRIGT